MPLGEHGRVTDPVGVPAGVPTQLGVPVAEAVQVPVVEQVAAPKVAIPPAAPVTRVRVSPSRASKRNDSGSANDHITVVREMLSEAAAAGRRPPGHPAVTARLGVTQYRARQLLQLASEAVAVEPITSGARRGKLAAVGQPSALPDREVVSDSGVPLAGAQQVANGSPGGKHGDRPASTTPGKSDRVRQAAGGGP